MRVRGQLVKLPRALFEFRVSPPREWTVVRGPFNAARVPVGAREGYLVCPNCRRREALPDSRVPATRCPRCNEVFAIAWNDAYPRRPEEARARPPAQGARSQHLPRPSGDTLAPDRRMTRRRSTTNRRNGLERRTAERRSRVFAAALVERRLADRRRSMQRRRGRERRAGSDRRQRAAVW